MDTKEKFAQETIKEYQYTKGQKLISIIVVVVFFCGLIAGGTALVMAIINNFVR